MIDIISDTLIDGIKLLPFLFITFLIIEYIEHKLSNRSKQAITKSGKYGPFFGSILGAFPQCGFGVSATNLYATRIISMGTLISAYLSTSDEMLPLLISNGIELPIILKILGLKVLIGMLSGFTIDFILRKRHKSDNIEIKDFCDESHCDCNHGIIKSSIKHTLSILLFIVIISFILNLGISYLGEDTLSKLFMKNSVLGPFIASLIGLIPNCAASVVITEIYLNGAITYGSMIAGLLTGAGVSLLVLFKINKNLIENIFILLSIYFVGAISGIIINLI